MENARASAPGAELRSYQPTWRDSLARLLLGDQPASVPRQNLVEGMLGSRGIGSNGPGLVDFTPLGSLLGFQSAWQAGDPHGMALSMLPIPPAARPAAELLGVGERAAAAKLSGADVENWLGQRGIPFQKKASNFYSDTTGPSASTYYKIQTPDGTRSIRLSDHDAPENFGTRGPLDFRYTDDPGATFSALDQQFSSIPSQFHADVIQRRIGDLEDSASKLDPGRRGNQGFFDSIRSEVDSLRSLLSLHRQP